MPPDVGSVRTGGSRMVWRGLSRRCPVCGRGGLGRHWVVLPAVCPGCGFRFERAPGHFVGAVGMNTMATFGLMLLTIVVGVVATLPDVPFTAITLVAMALAFVVPVAFHVTAKLLWVAIDLLMNPLEAHEAPLLGTTGLDDGRPDPGTLAEEGPTEKG